MHAAYTPTYGSPHVIELRDVPRPALGAHDIRIEVRASPVTAGDRRLRSADFPSVTAIPGRLMMGVLRPRNPVQGTMFAGRVAELGSDVTRWAVGDDVFGAADHGAWAEEVVVADDGPVAPIPEGVGYDEAAAVPYGAGTALHFLERLTAVQPGEKVLILGASGGVGRYAVSIARHLGAEVTAVCSRAQFDLVGALGAQHLVDHRSEDPFAGSARYDVIFDIADATTFSACRHALTETGRYATLYMSPTVLFHMAWTGLVGGPRALFSIAMPSADDLASLAQMLEDGVLRPTIVARYPLDRITEAHEEAESGVHGEVMVTIGASARLRAVG